VKHGKPSISPKMNIFGTLKLIAKIGFFDFLVDDEMVKNPFFTILESPKNTKNHISSTAGKLLNQADFFSPAASRSLQF